MPHNGHKCVCSIWGIRNLNCEGDGVSKNKKNKSAKKQKLSVAENAIRKIALSEGVTVEYVRKQMQIAMLNGLCSSDAKVKAFWDNIPCEKEVPSPEELIIHISEIIKRKP